MISGREKNCADRHLHPQHGGCFLVHRGYSQSVPPMKKPSDCLDAYLLGCQYVCLPVCLPVCLSACLSVSLSVCFTCEQKLLQQSCRGPTSEWCLSWTSLTVERVQRSYGRKEKNNSLFLYLSFSSFFSTILSCIFLLHSFIFLFRLLLAFLFSSRLSFNLFLSFHDYVFFPSLFLLSFILFFSPFFCLSGTCRFMTRVCLLFVICSSFFCLLRVRPSVVLFSVSWILSSCVYSHRDRAQQVGHHTWSIDSSLRSCHEGWRSKDEFVHLLKIYVGGDIC